MKEILQKEQEDFQKLFAKTMLEIMGEDEAC